MQKIDTTKDLPNWFLLENYTPLNKLGLEELIRQISNRTEILYLIESNKLELTSLINYESLIGDSLKKILTKDSSTNIGSSIWEFSTSMYAARDWFKISSGNPILQNESLVERSSDFLNNVLSKLTNSQNIEESTKHAFQVNNTAPAGYLTLGELKELVEKAENIAKEQCDYTDNSSDSIDVNNLLREEGIFLFTGNARLDRDKDLIKAFKNYISYLRKQLGVNVYEDLVYSRVGDRNNILSYQLIPYLDLQIWAKIEKLKVPLRIYAEVLYPNQQREEAFMTQTVNPFLSKIKSSSFVY